MSSHREAPEIAKDPVADSTDVYAFVSPDKPGTVTLIANYIPLQSPAAARTSTSSATMSSTRSTSTTTATARRTSPSSSGSAPRSATPDLPVQHRPDPVAGQSELEPPPDLRRVHVRRRTIGTGLACPPCNIGPLSTPDYGALAAQAVHQLGGGITVFAGQRAEGFYVDLGAIFDLGDLRPFEQLHATFGLPALQAAPGVNATNNVNVHSIAIQVPVSALTRSGHPTIGVWTTASRQRAGVGRRPGRERRQRPVPQVSRLGNPLVNEVLIPLGHKDHWNSLPPSDDKQFAAYVTQPGLAALLPVLYPGVFPNLAALASRPSRAPTWRPSS